MWCRTLVSRSISLLVVVALGVAAGLAPAEAAPKKGAGGGPGGGGGGGGTLKGKDTTAPTLVVPSDITTAATAVFGAGVRFSATATDDKDPAPVVVSSPPSGSTFRIGTTTVTVRATDWQGNSTTKTFKVTVGPYSGGNVAYKAYSADQDGRIYFEWDITVAANGTVTGAGHQTNVINFYDGFNETGDPLPSGLSGVGTVSGTISSDATCQFTSSRNYWFWTAYDYDADWNPIYTEDVGGFSGSTTASVDDAGNLYFTADPLAKPPDFYSGSNFWMRQ